jgi:hypothetical protein
VTDACNPSYWGGRDQKELLELSPGQIVCETLFGKTPSQKRAGEGGEMTQALYAHMNKKKKKRAGGVAQGVHP